MNIKLTGLRLNELVAVDHMVTYSINVKIYAIEPESVHVSNVAQEMALIHNNQRGIEEIASSTEETSKLMEHILTDPKRYLNLVKI